MLYIRGFVYGDNKSRVIQSYSTTTTNNMHIVAQNVATLH